jgi:hypothetical protein
LPIFAAEIGCCASDPFTENGDQQSRLASNSLQNFNVHLLVFFNSKTQKMKSIFVFIVTMTFFVSGVLGQEIKSSEVPSVVKSALMKKYPEATKVSWEKENGNYEANWGGKSGEDTAAQFTPQGVFVEIERAISINELPASVKSYVKEHENGAAIKEAAHITDANGKVTYEAEIKGKDLIFDENGKFLRVNTGD